MYKCIPCGSVCKVRGEARDVRMAIIALDTTDCLSNMFLELQLMTQLFYNRMFPYNVIMYYIRQLIA